MDAIDKVKRGAEITIREAPLPANERRQVKLQQGDILEENGLGDELSVGRKVGLFKHKSCPFCSTHMHWVNRIETKNRRGRDGVVYWMIKTFRTDAQVCPLCEYYDYDYTVVLW